MSLDSQRPLVNGVSRHPHLQKAEEEVERLNKQLRELVDHALFHGDALIGVWIAPKHQ
jgi:hypothetical protein